VTVARAAIAALADVANAAAADALRELAGPAPAELHLAVVDARLRCADRLAAAGQKEAAARVYADLWDSRNPVQICCGALRGLAAVRGREMTGPLLATVFGARPGAHYELAAVAAQELEKLRDPAVIGAINVAGPRRETPERFALLVDVLAAQGDVAADALVIKLAEAMLSPDASATSAPLDDEQRAALASMRLAGVRALANVGTSDAALVLARAAGAADWSVVEREAARKSLARLRAGGTDEALVKAAKDAEPLVCVELLRGLAARRCRTAVALFLEQARQPDERVRAAALEALGALARGTDAPALVTLLVSAQPDAVRKAAEEATIAVCGRIEPAEQRGAPVLTAWDGANPIVQTSLVRVLGRVGGAGALEKIRAARQSGEADLVDAAVRALADWPDAKVLDDLRAIAEHSDSETQRVLALRGYVRLLGLPSDREPGATAAMYAKAFELAQKPDDKKLVLAGLASVAHPDALRLAVRCLSDDALRAEAEVALVPIARTAGPLVPAEAQAALEQVAADTKNENTRKAAREALETLRKLAGHMTAWRVSGPYFETGKDWASLFDQAFPPEQPGSPDAAWRPLAPTNADSPWVFDLARLDNGANRCVYVRSAIWSDKEQPARLEIGSDDGVKVWVNDRVVHEAKVSRGYAAAQDKVPVTLAAGWNTVMLKVVQAGGGWVFSCTIGGSDGQTIDGLKFSADEPAPRQ
jgi:hypothetical protein